MGPKKVPYLITHDARTIRYPNPHIKSNDTVQVDIATGKIQEHIKFDTGTLSCTVSSVRYADVQSLRLGNIVMITGGHNLGRVGIIQSRERHPGSFDIVHVKDANGHTFATRLVLIGWRLLLSSSRSILVWLTSLSLAKVRNPGSHYQPAKVYVCRSPKNATVVSLVKVNREMNRALDETEEKKIHIEQQITAKKAWCFSFVVCILSWMIAVEK